MATNTTATTQNHNGTGSQNNFAISFAFLENTEVDVKVGGVLKTLGTHYNIVGSQVQFTSGNTPPSGTANVVFIRDTNISAKKVDFADGSVLTETDLDNNSDQILFAQQEFTNDYVKRDGSQTITGNLVFEGATDDDNELTLAITDPTADRTITVPDITGTLITSADTGTVSNQMIAGDAVTNAKIADNSIDSEHYVDGSIDNVHLANDAVNGNKIADDSINSEHYVDGSIDTQHIAADQITNALIADNQIDSEHYVDGSIDRQHLEADIIDGTKLADNAVNSEHIQANAVTDSEIATGTLDNRYYTETELNAGQLDNRYFTETELNAGQLDNRYYTETELNAGQLDNRYFTETESDARYFRQDSSETIASGNTWTGSDAFIATTAAIDLRVIELVDNVGGFVPIANETSFPTENPDINTSGSAKGGTIVSVQAASTALTAQSGTTLTIANGRGTGNAVIITGVSVTIPQGFGFLVETTATDHTYAFHRLVPKATEVSTVAANAVNIAAAGANVVDINNFADLYQISTSAPTQRADTSSLQIGDLWFDSSSNKVLMIYDGSSGDGFTAATPNASDLTNINIVAGQLVFQEDLGSITEAVSTGTGNQTLNTVAGIASNVTTVAGIASNVTAVANDSSDIGAVAAKATEIGRLGTAAAVADLAILGTTDVVADMNTLATTAIVSDMDTLADISSNITTVAGISSNVTAVAGNASNINSAVSNASNINSAVSNASNINAVAGNATNINAVAADAADIGAVAGKATEIGRLGTAAAVADMAILGTTDVVADMAILATTDVVADMNTLATADVVADMNTLATTSVVNNLNTVAGIASDVTAVANDATDIGAVAGKATEIGRLGTADAVADLAILGTADVVADMNLLATSDVIADMALLATTAVIADMALLATTDVIADMALLATTDVIADMAILATTDVVADLAILATTDVVADMNTLGTSSNVTAMSTCATNISDINTFANRYRIASSAPSTSLDVGDLYFDTTLNELRIYNGSAWQGGVTATGNLLLKTGGQMTGNITFSGSQTVDGRDLSVDGAKLDNIEANATADQTAAEIRTLVESASDSNVFTDADHTKLNGIEANATADQSNSEIKTAYEANSNTNAFTDALLSKLNGIEASATADQTASEIVSLISGQTIAPNVITTTNLTIDFGSIA